jgi:hypothetical protein
MSVALIGSSGGGAATLGHTEPVLLLQTIHKELRKIDGADGIKIALFVSMHGGKGLDTSIEEVDIATLYSVQLSEVPNEQCSIRAVKTGTLQSVNKIVKEMDADIAKAIEDNKIKGLICISCDPNLHSDTLRMAASMHIPVTGSGGTSISAATTMFGITLVGNSGGSVATTSYTRAVSYTHALATAWSSTYRPFDSSFTTPQWRSVLNACLPAFWGVTLLCRASELYFGSFTPPQYDLTVEHRMVEMMRSHVLPFVCCVIMATSTAPQHGSTAVMAACIAGVVCANTVLGGLLTGWIISVLIGRVLYTCICLGTPATMTNLIAGGGVGIVVAITMAPVLPYLAKLSQYIRLALHIAMSGQVPGLGFVIGCMFCYGSKVGYYHAIGLPVILIEMERGYASLFGSIDECTLVLVSAGICLGNLILPRHLDVADAELCKRGIRINLLFGDFIEAAYPFMEQSNIINFTGYLASGLSTELLTGQHPLNVLSMAYLPLPVSIWLAFDRRRIALAYLTALVVSFLGTVISNAVTRVKEDSRKND